MNKHWSYYPPQSYDIFLLLFYVLNTVASCLMDVV